MREARCRHARRASRRAAPRQALGASTLASLSLLARRRGAPAKLDARNGALGGAPGARAPPAAKPARSDARPRVCAGGGASAGRGAWSRCRRMLCMSRQHVGTRVDAARGGSARGDALRQVRREGAGPDHCRERRVLAHPRHHLPRPGLVPSARPNAHVGDFRSLLCFPEKRYILRSLAMHSSPPHCRCSPARYLPGPSSPPLRPIPTPAPQRRKGRGRRSEDLDLSRPHRLWTCRGLSGPSSGA